MVKVKPLTHDYIPLPERLRPQTLDNYVGQSHLLGPLKPLRRAIDSGRIHSMIFWGPPGTGKTTLALLLAKHFNAQFIKLNATLSGVKDIKDVVEKAKASKSSLLNKQNTILFVDEIHRFNKSQQDVLLPFVEDGTFALIGATTLNPSFELNSALLSRARVYILKPLSDDEMRLIIQNALAELGLSLENEELMSLLIQASAHDARRALNLIDMLNNIGNDDKVITNQILDDVLSTAPLRFDKKGEQFYDQISALHKSIRGTSPDGAVYWLGAMLEAGCDRGYLARRLIRMASEDIGNADPNALAICLNAFKAYEILGTPEGELALVQAAIYLAMAPKSNAVYMAYNSIREDLSKNGVGEVPLSIRNAPTSLMKEMGYGVGYQYAHDFEGGIAKDQPFLPQGIKEKNYYQPKKAGFENKIFEKLERIKELTKC